MLLQLVIKTLNTTQDLFFNTNTLFNIICIT